MIGWFTAILVMAFAAMGARGDVTLTLRPVARVDAGSAVTIADVCAGAEASGLGAIALGVRTAGGTQVEIDVAAIREALSAGGVRDAEVSIRGSRCVVVVRPEPEDDAKERAPAEAERVAEQRPAGATIGDHIRGKLEQVLGATGAQLDLRFEASDAAVLERATAGSVVDVHPLGLSRRTPVRVTLYAADGSIEVHRVLVGVRLLREVARASRVLARGSAVAAADFAVSAEWLGPDEAYVEPAAVIGKRIRKTLDAGEMLTSANVEPPIVIERGDVVMVHVVSGSVVLRREARALESGRAGQKIRLEPMAGGGEFHAEIEGPGRAVIVARPAIGGNG